MLPRIHIPFLFLCCSEQPTLTPGVLPVSFRKSLLIAVRSAVNRASFSLMVRGKKKRRDRISEFKRQWGKIVAVMDHTSACSHSVQLQMD